MKRALYILITSLLVFISCQRIDPVSPSDGFLSDTIVIYKHDGDTIIVYTIIHDTIYSHSTDTVVILGSDTIIVGPNIPYYPQVNSGYYSVSKTQKIQFAFGNLQYNPNLNIWRFAEHQYDYIYQPFDSGVQVNGWMDLFPYGYNYFPNDTAPQPESIDMYWYTDVQPINKTIYDWGNSCKITNDTASVGIWRTPTGAEWHYVLYERENADQLVSITFSNQSNFSGYILYPDGYTGPKIPEKNVPKVVWSIFEKKGCVFLPLAGFRTAYNLYGYGLEGAYWTSTMNYSRSPRVMPEIISFDSVFAPSLKAAYFVPSRYSVRLIKDVNE